MSDHWSKALLLRRTAFVLGNSAILALFFWLAIAPIQMLFRDRDTIIAEQRLLLAHLNAIANQAATVKELGSGLDVHKDRVEFLLGANEGVVAANLQRLLKGMIQSAGAQLRSVRTLPVKADGSAKFIGAHVDIRGPIRAIHQAVQSIEAAKPYLFVISAVLKPSARIGIRSAIGKAEPTLDAQLDIVGAMQSGEPN